MDDVDRMIFDALVNELHCSFTEKVACLNDLGPDQIVEAVVRCLWRCSSSVAEHPISSYRLPNNPIEKFRFASKISAEIQALGIRDYAGYQSLLYPNIFDSRRLFLSLFERFPKETVKSEQKHLTPLERLKMQIGETIASQLRENWAPEFCRFYDLQRIGRLWYPKKRDSGEEENIWRQIGQREEKERRVEPPKIAPKPKLPPKPQLPSQSLKISEEETKCSTSMGRDDDERREEEQQNRMIVDLAEKLTQKREKLAQKREIISKLRAENDQMAEKIAERRAQEQDERFQRLLEDPEANLEKLEQYISEANERRMALEAKFAEAKEERMARLEELAESGREEREAELDRGIRTMEEAVKERNRIAQKMRRECERMAEEGDGDTSRAKYVQRIFEISGMVGKQNEQIRKTATSVQSLRHEISMLMGGLERTFIAVDRWLGKQAETNPRMQRAHKLLVRTHEQCAIVKESIEEQGQLNRQIDELTDKIGVEMQKSVDEQLERLLDDLMMIRHENDELEKKLTRAGE